VTHTDDDALVTFVRERALGAVPAPGLHPTLIAHEQQVGTAKYECDEQKSARCDE